MVPVPFSARGGTCATVILMSQPSTKPYLVRAIYEWCSDNGFTPYLAVVVGKQTRVPMEFVKDGQIVLNVSTEATNRLVLGNEYIEFQARFGGVARDISVPLSNVVAIYARENGGGMAFELEVDEDAPGIGTDKGREHSEKSPDEPPPGAPPEPPPSRPRLQRIK